MAMAVQADRVPRCDDLGRQPGSRCTCSPTRKNVATAPAAASVLQNGRRALRVRPIVERQRVPSPVGGAILDSERPAQAGPCARESGEQIGAERQSRQRGARDADVGAMIVGRHARSCARDPGCDRGFDALQPRGRAPGGGRQAGPAERAPARGAGLGPPATGALAARHGPVGARLAAAGDRPAARAAGRGAARACRRAVRAAVRGRADARRARGALRAPRDGRDRDRRGRHRPVRSAAQHDAHIRAADDHAGVGRPRPRQPAALCPAAV